MRALPALYRFAILDQGYAVHMACQWGDSSFKSHDHLWKAITTEKGTHYSTICSKCFCTLAIRARLFNWFFMRQATKLWICFWSNFLCFSDLETERTCCFRVIWTTMLELLLCISFAYVDNSNVFFIFFHLGQNPPPVRGFGERARAPSASKYYSFKLYHFTV